MTFPDHKDTSFNKRPAGHVDQTDDKFLYFPWSPSPRHAHLLFEDISTFTQNMAPNEKNMRGSEDIPLEVLDQDLSDPPRQPTSSPEESSVDSPGLSPVTSPELSSVSSPELSSLSSGELSSVSSKAVYSDSEDCFNWYNPRGIRNWRRGMHIRREDSDEEDEANGSFVKRREPSTSSEEEEDEFMSVREGKRPAPITNPIVPNRKRNFGDKAVGSRESSPENSDEGSRPADSIYRFATSHMDYCNAERLDYVYIYYRDPPRFLDFVHLLYVKHRVDGFKRIYRVKVILKGDFINFRVGRISCQYEWEKILKIMDEENLQAEVLYRTKEEESVIPTDSVSEVAIPEAAISEAVISKITMPEVTIPKASVPEVEHTDRSPILVTIDKFIEDTVKEIGTTNEAIRIKETADSVDQGFKMVKKLFQHSIKVIVGQVGENGFGQTVDQNHDQDIQQGPRRNLKRNADQLDEENVEEDVKQNVEQDKADASDIDHMEVDDI